MSEQKSPDTDTQESVRPVTLVVMAIASLGSIAILGTLILQSNAANPCNITNPPIPKSEWCGKVILKVDQPVTLNAQEGTYVVLLHQTTINNAPAMEINVTHPHYADPIVAYDPNLQPQLSDLADNVLAVGDVVVTRWKQQYILWYPTNGTFNDPILPPAFSK